LVAGTLIVLGIVVILRRRDVISLLKAGWPIALYFAFCLVSLLWSDFPGWGFKRWIRAVGDLVMVLIIITDAQPTAALSRFLSRVGFVLLPASVLLSKYYPSIGRGYDEWGYQANTGVTTNKNMLGVLTYVIALGTLWQVIRLLGERKQPNRNRRLLAQCTLLGFGIQLLSVSHSATSGASFALGAGLMVAAALPFIRRRPAAVHALVLAILLGGGLIVLLAGTATVVEAMGRKSDLTGRTEVWEVLIPMAPNPIVGSGFETFWLGPRAEAVENVFNSFVNESHNGYIEIYLNLGWVGLSLIALLLLEGYRRAVGAFRRDPALGALCVAYIVTAVTYNISEAGFRMLDPLWVFLLLAFLFASRITGVPEAPSQSRQGLADPVFAEGDSVGRAHNFCETNL
jgi:O-antigen ligase